MKSPAQLARIRSAAAIFTDDEVRAIRLADASGRVSRKEQAAFYGVGKETIARLCRGETYGWVGQDAPPPGTDPLVADPPPDVQEAAHTALVRAIELQRSLNPDEMVKAIAQPSSPTKDE